MSHRLERPHRRPRALLLAAAWITLGAAGPQGVGKAGDDPTAISAEPGDQTAESGGLAEGIELLRNGRHEDARRALEPVVARRPDWPAARLYLAMAYYKQQRWETAAKHFKRLRDLDPNLQESSLPYGWCLYYLGELEKAREMFRAFLQVKPGYMDAIFALGLIDFDDDKVESARDRFSKAIELAERQGDVGAQALFRARLADVLVRMGDLNGAKRELEKSIGLDADNAKTYFKLSRVLQQMGDSDGARKAHRAYAKIRAGAQQEEVQAWLPDE